MAQDLCPRFVDYFGMGHFHHKVRVPGRGERWGRALERYKASPSQISLVYRGLSFFTLAWEGEQDVWACPISHLGEPRPRECKGLP